MRKHSSASLKRIAKYASRSLTLTACLFISFVFSSTRILAQQGGRLELGRVQAGAAVSFIHSASGEWGIDISGGPAPRIAQLQPVRLEVYRADDDIRQLAAGYKTVQKSAGGINAEAEIAYGDSVVFRVHDGWTISSSVLKLHRNVEIRGNAPGGFYSSISFVVDHPFHGLI